MQKTYLIEFRYTAPPPLSATTAPPPTTEDRAEMNDLRTENEELRKAVIINYFSGKLQFEMFESKIPTYCRSVAPATSPCRRLPKKKRARTKPLPA